MNSILSFATAIRNRTSPLNLGLLAIFLLSPTFAVATQNKLPSAKVHEHTLDNGLKILVKPDHRAPIVVSQLWYKVGASYEHGGITGVSHVLEHMMFKGTNKYPTGEFDRIIAENGAQSNAFTSQDYTAYYQVVEKSRLETVMTLEADRMRGLTLPPEEFKKEIKVVQEERRWRVEDSPNALVREQFSALAYTNSPYHNPVIGWMNDLQNMQIEDLKQWYQQWYAPNNAVLVVVGDVEPKAVFALAKRLFGDFKSETIAPPKPQREAPQRGKRHAIVKAPAEVPFILMGYKTPSLMHAEEKWEPYALEVLASVLDGGSSSRMSAELVRGKELAAYAGAGYSGFGRLDQHFTLAGVPAKDVTLEALEAALLAQVERVQKEPVTQEELARVKSQVIAGEVYERDSVQHQATVLGSLESVGLGYELIDDYVDNISAITAEQVQQVAKKYLREDQLTVVELDPQPIDRSKSKFRPNFVR